MTGPRHRRFGPRTEGDPERIAAGWERRFIADRHRAQEAAELYGRLGYEVCLEPLGPEDLSAGCEDCALVELMGFRVVYTRWQATARPPSEAAE